MGLNHIEPGYTDEAAPFIEENGGKIGGLSFIKAKDPKLAELVPDTVIVPPDKDEINEIPFDMDVIVRASHKNDFQGLVDVLKTEVVKRGPDMVKRINEAIRLIREACKSGEVMEYGRYENPDFDGEVSIGIQPFFNFPIASVMEHPNQPETYIVSHVVKGGIPGFGVAVSDSHVSKIFNNNGEELNNFVSHCLYEPNKPKRIIDAYRQVQRLGLLRDGFVPQVEFGDEMYGDGLKILQIRVGARREIASFTLDNWSRYIDLVLGVTEGMELPLFYSCHYDDLGLTQVVNDSKFPFAFMRTWHMRRMSLDFRPTNMAVYLANFSFGSGHPGLEHNQLSLIQKAEVSVFEKKYGCAFEDLDKGGHVDERYDKYPQIPEGFTGDKVRIVSDGIHALVELI
ncbi:MAG: hypothetical protein AAB739_00140 [Patescibacteria group bacterium]